MELAAEAASGRAARTVVGGHERNLRHTVLVLTGGRSLVEHRRPRGATLQILPGRVRLHAGTDVWDGRTGDLLILPSGPHSLDAVEDAVVLLTVATS
jgi:quercetin dioxygenase-like cupin family protein